MRISDWSSDVCSSDLVEALDRHGKPFVLEVDDLLATCIQHEVDHLDGKLFIDYLSPLKRDRALKRSEEHTSELQSLMRISYAVFCLKKKKNTNRQLTETTQSTKNHRIRQTTKIDTKIKSQKPHST